MAPTCAGSRVGPTDQGTEGLGLSGRVGASSGRTWRGWPAWIVPDAGSGRLGSWGAFTIRCRGTLPTRLLGVMGACPVGDLPGCDGLVRLPALAVPA